MFTQNKLSSNFNPTNAKYIWALFVIISIALLVGTQFSQTVQAATPITFTAGELLGKPTDTSITINIVPAATIEYHYQYGTASGGYDQQTTNFTATGGQPHEITITGLTANTRYYYRMRYHAPGDAMDDWVVRDEHSFHTQRAPGSTFVFTVTSDDHYNRNTNTQNAMQGILNDQADFHVDLGDTFYIDSGSTQSAADARYLAYREPLIFGKIGPSVPIFLSSGNHENEEGWNLDDTPTSLGIFSIQGRKAYFPTPVEDGVFYTGNTDPLERIDDTVYGDKLRENYYAWEWGDALFVVIDPFQYTMNLPYAPNTAGEGNDDPFDGDQWSWTLGDQQYWWLKEVLESSTAKYKFMFSHQMLGGITRPIFGVAAGYVRGGAEAAAYFEWGGKNASEVDEFSTMRPGWPKTIHQLMVENGVSAYFHGHDHQYVYETRDGIVYQEVPSPGMTGAGFSGIYTVGNYEDYQTIAIHPNAGYLRLTVAPAQTTVEYVRSNTTGITHSYTIEPNAPQEPPVCFALSLTSGPNGTAPTANPTKSPGCPIGEYTAGALINLTAHPNTGYQVAAWSNTDNDNLKTLTNQVTMPAEPRTVHVIYEVRPVIPVVELDGVVSSNTANNTTSISIPHITGTGTNRLMLVGISWNSGTSAKNITGVTFVYDAGPIVVNFVEVITEEVVVSGDVTGPRYAAIYRSTTEPPLETEGTVIINFDTTVENGIVAGAANFKGVDQNTPLGTPVGAHATSTSSSPSLTLTSLTGNELVFDTVFLGGSDSNYNLSVGSGQSQHWNDFSGNTRGTASSEQAEASSVVMSWTPMTQNWWALAAVPINPALGEPPIDNQAPTEILLSRSYLAEGQPVGTVVGSFKSLDPDKGDTHTYSLVIGEGSTDNAAFTIFGDELQTAEVFDYATKSSYSIRIHVSDAGGLTFEQSFAITILQSGVTPPQPSSFFGQIHCSGVEAGDTIIAFLDGDTSPIWGAAIEFDDNLGASVYDINVPARADGSYPISVTLVINDQVVTKGLWIENADVEVNLCLMDIELVADWNLVSFNVKPASTDLRHVLVSIEGIFDLVYAWDETGGSSAAGNWMIYDPNMPTGNSLSLINETMGFWIRMTEAAQLTISGSFPTESDIDLNDAAGGWNLVGYPSSINRDLPDALEANGVEDFTLVYAYHSADLSGQWQIFDIGATGYANSLEALSPGWGYWIFVIEDAIWTVEYE